MKSILFALLFISTYNVFGQAPTISSFPTPYFLVDSAGTKLHQDGYESIYASPHGYFIATRLKLKGLLSKDGLLISRLDFQNIIPCQDGSFWANKDHFPYYKYDVSGKKTAAEPLDYVGIVGKGMYYWAHKGSSISLYNAYGNQILEDETLAFDYDGYDGNWTEPVVYCNALVELETESGTGAIINPETGEIVRGDKQDYFFEADSLLVQHTDTMTKVYDRNLTLIHEMQGHFRPFRPYWINLKASGLYSEKGKKVDRERTLVPHESRNKNYMVTVNQYNQYGLIDKKGKQILEEHFTKIETYEKYIVAKKNGYSGALNYEGKTIVPFEFDNVGFLSYYDHFKVVKDKKTGFYDTLGNEVIKLEFEVSSIVISKDFFLLRKNGLYGIYDKKGKQVIPFEYSDFRVLKNGFIGAKNKAWDIFDDEFIYQKSISENINMVTS